MNNRFKIETHVHTRGISPCATADYEAAATRYIEEGFSGFVLANHLSRYTMSLLPCSEADAHKIYVDEFYKARDFAGNDIKIYMGAEVTIKEPGYDWFDLLIFGATPEFFLENKFLYNLSQKELFSLCDQNGLLLVQAHPFREPCRPGDAKYLHGMEINKHEGHRNYEEKTAAYAERHGLIVTCGTDFHYPNQTIAGGITVTHMPKDERQLADMIRAGDFEIYTR